MRMTIDEQDNLSLLRELALAGHQLFHLIFEGDDADNELIEVGDWLRAQIVEEQVAILQVVAEGFPVPWPLLYLAERWDERKANWNDFIGMQCVVEQLPLRNPTQVCPPPSIDSRPQLRVRALFNDTIDESIPTMPLAE